jgi:phosphopantothenoylcysteine synthetase/decarboxylase
MMHIRKKDKTVKKQITKTGKLLGAYVPAPVVDAICVWVEQAPERDKSTFIREAAREKLRRDGIDFIEGRTPEAV